ncbi:LysR family transcriptional regulator [Paenibacillus arenilitoris]|uniref:LysR family transcriptional regulator n=1 Tax=Paenibacillus arenilitoris TaxID=2772299 RepID=A0A927H4U8_9BACL|nr:LysR family transcriptional regulator [Paenibacillus arenilitoris]MBD2868250.1 LysR family transcriptional regulator [Paenibacillus arenilitoris]
MELLQLQYFRTVARKEHMTRAAEELRIAQPALSKTISRLEEDLGVPLFDREGRQIRLNAFGKAFLRKVETALTALEEGRKEVREMSGLDQGSIHLATSTLDLLTEPLAEFVSAHPKVSFRITQASAGEMEELLASGEVDICFTPLPLEGPGFKSAQVLNEDVFLAVPPGHRLAGRESVALAEVANDPFIGYKEGMLFQPMNDAFMRKAGISPKFVCRVDEPSAISRLVQAGLGVALVGGCGRVAGTPLTLLPISAPACGRSFQVVWHEKRYLSVAVQQFRDFIVQYFGKRRNSGAKTEGKKAELAG